MWIPMMVTEVSKLSLMEIITKIIFADIHSLVVIWMTRGKDHRIYDLWSILLQASDSLPVHRRQSQHNKFISSSRRHYQFPLFPLLVGSLVLEQQVRKYLVSIGTCKNRFKPLTPLFNLLASSQLPLKKNLTKK